MSDQKQSTNAFAAIKKNLHSKIKFIKIATVQCLARNLQFTIILKYKPSTLIYKDAKFITKKM